MVDRADLYLPRDVAREYYGEGRNVFDDLSDPGWSLVQTGGVANRNRPDEMTAPYSQSEWVYACVRAIASNIAGVPLVVNTGTRESPERVQGGPIYDLMRQPQGPGCPTSWFSLSVISWLQLKGEAFLVPIAEVGGVEMIPETPTIPSRFEIPAPGAIDWDKDKGQWKIPMVGEGDAYRDEQALVQPKFWNPNDAHRGMSPLILASLAADPIYQANLYNSALLRNSADPGGVITYPKRLAKPEADRLRDQVNERHQGPQKAGRPMLLTDGATFAFNPRTHRDMQFVDQMKLGRDAICAIYGVPKVVVSVTDSINFATALAAERSFWTRTLIPTIAIVLDRVNAYLEMAGSREWVAADLSGIEALQQSRAERIDEGKGLVEIGYTPQEVNATLSLGMPDADGAAWRDRPETTAEDTARGQAVAKISADVTAGIMEPEPAKVILVEVYHMDPATAGAIIDASVVEFEEQPTPAPVLPFGGDAEPSDEAGDDPAPDDEKNNTANDEIDDGRGASLSKHAKGTRAVNARRQMFLEWSERAVPRRESAYARDVMKAFRKQQRLADALLVKLGKRSTRLPADAVEAFSSLQAEWSDIMAETLDGEMWTTIEKSAKQAAREVASFVDVDRADPRWNQIVEKRLNALKDVNATTAKRLKASLGKGIGKGEGVADLRKRIEGVFGSRARAATIARTEVGVLQSVTRQGVFEDNGVASHEWVTSQDDRVRESHVDVDGEVVPIGTPFRNGLLHPHDPAGPPEEVVNCRCDSVAVFE